jgi:hypothetical protein
MVLGLRRYKSGEHPRRAPKWAGRRRTRSSADNANQLRGAGAWLRANARKAERATATA